MSEKKLHFEEKEIKPASGLIVLFINTIMILGCITVFVLSIIYVEGTWMPLLVCLTSLLAYIIGPILYAGLRNIKPNEALVLTLFGKYYGTIKEEGFYWVNPCCIGVNPLSVNPWNVDTMLGTKSAPQTAEEPASKKAKTSSKIISLKTMTLSNKQQKINDQLGNPIIVGVVVTWRIENTVKAVFNVDNYEEYVSIQCDSVLRNVVRLYPYDLSSGGEDEKTLRGSSQEISSRIRDELQECLEIAGIQVLEARITHLSYAPEIAAAMLQRQQASAVVDARKMIVDGAVGMVEMALAKLNENDIVSLDEERKAAMVSNLLVVLCGNKEAQPIVNSGSLY
ncbi:MAG: SPFH domain-containing protein [Lachnoclostridium sp.]|jgi:regulator of protease activity HflC (stomatin/prohibitin superfamily)|nr:SPFH domain-containing protein [Lachnoclostridium sp.]